MKIIIALMLSKFTGVVHSELDWNCSIFYNKQLDASTDKDIVEIKLNHQFSFNRNEMFLNTYFVNNTANSYHVLTWNNFSSPILRLYKVLGNGKIKYINSKIEVHELKDMSENKINCSTETIYSNDIFKSQHVEYDLNKSYDFSPTETYCLESKELHLLDLVNNKIIITSSPSYLVYFDAEWKVKTLEENFCFMYENGFVDDKDIIKKKKQ